MNEPVVLRIHNPHLHEALFRVVVHWGGLPEGAQLVVGLMGEARTVVQAVGATPPVLPPEIDVGCGRKVKTDPSRIYRLAPDKQRRSALPEVLIAAGQTAFAAIHVGAIATLPQGPAPRFDVVQMEGERVVGGCTVQVRKAVASKSSNDSEPSAPGLRDGAISHASHPIRK